MKSEYKKLPGRGKNLVGTSTLWMGKDHLLSVVYTLVSERYRRFYFKDIQALVVRKTVNGKVINFLFSSPIFICAIVMLAMGAETTGFLIGVVVVFGILLGINLLRGPTCEVFVKTAVQMERLPALNRLKKYRKASERIKKRIEQVQPPLTQAQILNGFCAPAPAQQAKGIRPVTDSGSDSQSENQSERGVIHMWLYGAMLLSGLVMAVWFNWQYSVLPMLSIATTVTGSILVILALVRQHQSDMGTALRSVTWLSMIYFGISLFRDYLMFEFSYMGDSFFYDEADAARYDVFASFIMENSVMVAIRGGFAVTALILGVLGIWLSVRHYRTSLKVDASYNGV